MSAPAPAPDLVLTGPMGAGKSSTGRSLSRLLGRRFVDLDELVVEREGRTVRELFARGEAEFRDAERRAVGAFLAEAGEREGRVLALGGGTLQSGGVAEELARKTTLVHLDAPPEQLALRIGSGESRGRPLLDESEDTTRTLGALRDARAGGYARAAVCVDTAELDARDAAVATLRALYDPRDGPWREAPRPVARTRSGAGEVTIGRGAFPAADASVLVSIWDDGLPSVHERAVAPLAAAGARERYVPLGLAGGESAKTAATLVDTWRRLLEARVDKDAAVHVVGGGAVCDVAGLAVHTFKRGLPLSLHPTTLVAQLDAALGGKTAINLAGVKNVVGTVRIPRAVHIDPLFLPTLARADLSNGLAEAVKTAVVGDAELFEIMERGAPALVEGSLSALEPVEERAARVKLGIVERDLHDEGERRHLNLGHTLGHALESATAGTDRALTHGEAVAVGLSFAARLARRVGVLDEKELPERIDALLGALGLPAGVPQVTDDELSFVRAALAQDKKRRCGRNVWVLPRRRGEVVVVDVAREDVRAELD